MALIPPPPIMVVGSENTTRQPFLAVPKQKPQTGAASKGGSREQRAIAWGSATASGKSLKGEQSKARG